MAEVAMCWPVCELTSLFYEPSSLQAAKLVICKLAYSWLVQFQLKSKHFVSTATHYHVKMLTVIADVQNELGAS